MGKRNRKRYWNVGDRPRGLGDTVANVLHRGAIGKVVYKMTGQKKPCGGCRKRQLFLNKVVPYHVEHESASASANKRS